MQLILPHPSIANKPWCVHTSHRPYGYPPFTLCSWQWTHWNPWCNLQHLCRHCVKCWFPCGTTTITCISFNHIQLLLSMNWHCAYQIWNCTLTNVVITDPTWIDLLPQSCATRGFVASDAIQANERSYYNWHPTNQFLPLALEICGCLHKHVDVFLHDYANAIWSLKGIECFHLSTLVTFLCQKNLITLQRMQVLPF